MPIDLELGEIGLGGQVEPKAAWTEQGRENLRAAVAEYLGDYGAQMTDHGASSDDGPPEEAETQLSLLHRVVVRSILASQYGPRDLLPAKSAFDWRLGRSARDLRERSGADYALFITLSGDSESAKRKGWAMAAAGIFGPRLAPGGRQSGYASLVDLRDGRIVWFKPLDRQGGDLLNEDAARDTIRALLRGFPV